MMEMLKNREEKESKPVRTIEKTPTSTPERRQQVEDSLKTINDPLRLGKAMKGLSKK